MKRINNTSVINQCCVLVVELNADLENGLAQQSAGCVGRMPHMKVGRLAREMGMSGRHDKKEIKNSCKAVLE